MISETAEQEVGAEDGFGGWVTGFGLLLIAEDAVGEEGEVDGAEIFGGGGEHGGMGGGVVEIHDVRGHAGCAACEQIGGDGIELVSVARDEEEAGSARGEAGAGGFGDGRGCAEGEDIRGKLARASSHLRW